MKKYVFSLFVMTLMLVLPFSAQGEALSANEKITAIKEQLQPPSFPNRTFNIKRYGAVGNGKSDSTAAFKKAIEAANKAGGGRVVVPPGTYVTGAIYLKSNVNLHIMKKATIKFSQNPDKYLPAVLTRWEGVELYNYSPLIYAYNEKNIAITGEGTLDGQGDNEHWWPWKGKQEFGWKEGEPNQQQDRDLLFKMAEEKIPVKERVFGKGHYLRPSFIQPYHSKNIIIKGVTILNSPMWQINPVLSENILIDDVKIIGHGPNNDGVDPESSKNVLIKDSYFDNGDDCIAIKSGRNADGRRINVPSENIIIEGNEMKDGHGGVVIGSEISGSVRNVFAQHNVMDSPNLDRALRIKTNSVRGGTIEDIDFSDNTVKSVGSEVIQIDMYYEEGDTENFTPVVRNINIENLQSNGGKYGVWIRAYERSPVTNLTIRHSNFQHVATPLLMENVKNPVFEEFCINGSCMNTNH
ncbi:glycoside hydrolase family 28 protein [Priestia aryabhattai]|uniref:glycoside hydrolase family 28 protein n=1 Tax=Priestia TaxID=2800373 RepID=UPI00203C0A06|nr:glycoside hydrolase family 28 protein [Priestia aryabhattai]MCM3772550.1 glycoside hydrolase family 28 protein [Priestia aryabhattai]